MKMRWLFTGILLLAGGRAAAAVFINEIMWPGSDLSTADEWVELRADAETDVSGWKLTTVVTSGLEETILTFPAGTVLSSGSLTVIANYPAMESRLATDAAFITTAVSLPNTKLLLRLRNASGQVMDVADDGVGDPFAGANPSGGGPKASMERFGYSGAVKLSWATATTTRGFNEGVAILGTPGFPNGSFQNSSVTSSGSSSSGSNSSPNPNPSPSPNPNPNSSSGSSSSSSPNSNPIPISVQPFLKLKITEVLANPKGADDEEWIEIGNQGSEPADLTGLILDEGNSAGNYVIPTGTGSVLAPGEHRAYRKSLTGLPLDNDGEMLSLKKGDVIFDSWAYPETAEEVSYGRGLTDPNSFQAFCVPTEGKPNTPLELDPHINIQTGTPVAAGKVTLNLEATVASGSLASATCNWDYGDGFLSSSCNPPSHTFSKVGTYQVHLTVQTYCINTLERSLEVMVLAAGSAAPGHIDLPPSDFGSGATSGCESTPGSDIRISEAIPNPVGDEIAEEWIELVNLGSTDAHLCGWVLDDALEGSQPYTLSDTVIPPAGFLVFPRKQTGIALNNDSDSIRLLASDGALREIVSFANAPPGESYALRNDGNFVWTPFLTRGAENRFRTAERRFPSDRVVVSAALPNPAGIDKGFEWIELMNVSDDSFALTDWFLDNKDGGSKPFSLDGILLGSMESRRFESKDTGLELVNTSDSARLLDPESNVVSVLSWTDALEGRIYRPYAFSTERVPALVTRVIDGDTIEIVLTDIDKLDRIPESLRRRWLALNQGTGAAIRVRLIGIDAPETVHPFAPVQRYGMEASNYLRALIEAKNIELEFDTELWDKYQRLLAYIHMDDRLIQAEMLRSGLAYAYLRFPFNRAGEFMAYESEARKAKLGFWSDSDVSSWVNTERGIGSILFETGSTVPQPYIIELDIMPEKFYATGALVISEIFASPAPGAEEWIELLNVTDENISLFGWHLDDKKGKGTSRPWNGSGAFIIPAYGLFVLSGSTTKIAFNNAGDDVYLISPNGNEVRIAYPKLSRGQSYAACDFDIETADLLSPRLSARSPQGEGGGEGSVQPSLSESFGRQRGAWSVTDVPTPGRKNICHLLPPELKNQKIAKAKVAITSTKKKSTPKTRASIRVAKRNVRYLNVLATETSTGAIFGIGPQTSDQVVLLSMLASQNRPSSPHTPPIQYAFEFEVLAVSLSFTAFLRMAFRPHLAIFD